MQKMSTVQTRSLFLGLLLTASTAAISGDICNQCSCSSIVVNCSSRGLLEVPFISNTTGVQILDLSGNNIKYVSTSSLLGVAGTLRLINLGNNQITGIEDEAFASMPGLQTIVLSQNSLSSLPDNVFQQLDLTLLDLSYNNFGTVPSTSLRNLKQVNILYLNNNPLQLLSATAFDNVAGIEELDLSYCNLNSDTFQPKALNKNNFGFLQKLTLDGNSFPYLQAAFFEDFVPSLISLSLQNCNIQTVEQRSFSILRHLQELDLDYNPIQVLEKNLFYGIVLTTLSLQNCRINKIHSGAFNQSSIDTLKLNNNDLTRIRGVDFYGLYAMSELVLSYNKISSITGAPFAKQQIVHLDNNKLVDASFGNFGNSVTPMADLRRLRYLDISSNQLTRLPNLYTSNSKLAQLLAHDNQIVQLGESDLRGMSSLTILDLSNNNITQISINALSDCTNLYKLNLENNRIISLPSLHNQSNLYELSVSHCQIEALPSDLCQTCPGLRILSVEYNQLTSVPNLSGCKNLIEVLLEQNLLTTLDVSTFKGLSRLRTIDLSYNAISSLTSGTFQGLLNLNYLYLDYNAIRELPSGIFEDLVNLNRVDLNNNNIESLPDNLFQRTHIISDIRLNNNNIQVISPIAFANNLTYLQRLNLSSNAFSEWAVPKGGFPSLIQLSLADVEQLYQVPNPVQCGCPGIQQLEFTYSYHCCLWQDQVNPLYLEPTATPVNEDGDVTLPIYNPTFPPMITVIPPFHPGDNSDLGQLIPILDWFAAAYNLKYTILPGPVIIWTSPNNTLPVLTPTPPTVLNLAATRIVICYPRGDALTPCSNLMDPWPLRVAIWFVLVLALLGNGSVLFVMLASKDKIKVPQFFISNLAFADFCLGIYLAFLACVDARTYGNYLFYQSALEWQKGPGCLTAGFIAVFSSMLSCCMLVSVTLERVYTIYRSPKPGISMSGAIIIAMFCWLISFAFAALPLVGVNSYSRVAVCLPFVTADFKDKVYIGVLLTISMVAFLIILVSYVVIWCTVCRSPAIGQSRKETVKLLRKMAPLIITDFLCWFPIVVVGYSAISDKILLDAGQAKWLVVLVYPFNACANPFWYAIFTKNFRHRIQSLFKRTTGYLQTPNAIGLRIHLGRNSRSRNELTEEEKRIRRQSHRSRSVVAYTHTAVFGTLHGEEAPAEPYMGRRASLPAVLRQSERTNHQAGSLTFQMRMPLNLHNNSLPNVFEATERQVAESSLTESSDSSRLHKSLSVLKEIPEAEDIDVDNKSVISTQSDEYQDAQDHVAEAPCCPHQMTQDFRSLDSCCCSTSSNAATETSLDSSQHINSAKTRVAMNYTLDCNSSFIGSETEV